MARGARLEFDFTGLQRALGEAEDAAVPAAKVGLYECARATADAIRAEAGRLPFKESTVSQIQNAIGVAKFQDTPDGSETSISVDGYFADSHFPIIYFAREVESGTSRIQANPFMRRGANRVKAQAEAAGNEAAEQFVRNIIDNIED